MFRITVKSGTEEKTAFFDGEILLSHALEQMGFLQNKPCGGIGICGKCKVIANGKEVLSCQTYVSEDTYVNYNTDLQNIQGLTHGFMKNFNKNPLVDEGLGMAVDIGTTTIAGYLYKFPECECIKSVALPNTQAVYGADVISRIEYSNKGGLETLQKTVAGQIEKLAESMPIEKYVITGNTTMLHLLTGKDPSGIAVAPFIPQTLFGEWYDKAYLPSCISAYVGADITTAILSSGMLDDKTAFLVDIGTNGEMALWHDGKLVCCSTAAGPAFEGAGIARGTLAVSGAINKVYIEEGQLKYKTVDDKPPVGICGTGLVDAIACMLELEIIDETGYMDEDFEIGDSKIFITSEDVRQVQLAKSAIRSGIDTLLNTCGITCGDIENFYIAGGFGSYIDKESAAKIGLIPKEVMEKTVITGNGAGSGAVMILQSRECLEKSQEIADMAETVELSQSPYFMEKYIDNMMFGSDMSV